MAGRSSLLIVRKPTGVTSFSSLYPVKKTIDKKVGHAGTLDRFAEGLMIVLTGSFTRLNPLFSGLDKRYEATIHFGIETSTLDPEGNIVATGPIPSIETVERVLAGDFSGSIDQVPPSYSAIHIGGKRAYRLACSGEDVEIPARVVRIHETRILAWDPPFLRLEVQCSKGTYIRSLARDIAIRCDTRAHLAALRRTAIGPYRLEEAVDPGDPVALAAQADDSRRLLSRMDGFCEMVVDDDSVYRLRHGALPDRRSIVQSNAGHRDTHAVLLDKYGSILAVATLDASFVPSRIVSLPCAENSDGNI